jgi:hypothetical protein
MLRVFRLLHRPAPGLFCRLLSSTPPPLRLVQMATARKTRSLDEINEVRDQLRDQRRDHACLSLPRVYHILIAPLHA